MSRVKKSDKSEESDKGDKMAFGNTNKSRTRNWAFTLNNFMQSEINNIQRIDCRYLFQEETGENGTPHLQGTLMFREAKTMSSVKKLLPRAHLEPCRDVKASCIYSCKEESRTGEIYSNFDYTEFTQITQPRNRVARRQLSREEMRQIALSEINQRYREMMLDPDWANFWSNHMNRYELTRNQHGWPENRDKGDTL